MAAPRPSHLLHTNLRRGARCSIVACSIVACVTLLLVPSCKKSNAPDTVSIAVEFMDHAAAAYVAQEQGSFARQGLTIRSYKSYGTGMALAAALARDDIDAAYICLVPAICAYANAKVPIKVVAGTHRYGYALVVNPQVVKRLEDLNQEQVRLGSVRVGGAADLLLNRAMEKQGLNRKAILTRVRRMGPPKLLRAMQGGQLDAAFLPMQWAAMAEENGFSVLLTGRETWPGMPGSVLVVKAKMLEDHPREVRALVAATRESTEWVKEHPKGAAEVMVRALSLGNNGPADGNGRLTRDLITVSVLQRSMSRIDYGVAISEADVEAVIAAALRYGYIREAFPARDILDTRYL